MNPRRAFALILSLLPALGLGQQPEKPDDAADEPVIEEEVQAESAELEALRQAEEKAKVADGPQSPEDAAARVTGRLGLESPLRLRLRDALGRDLGGVPGAEGSIALLPEIGHSLEKLQAEYDIPIDVNDAVVRYVRFFQSPGGRKFFVRWMGRAHKYIPRFQEILREAKMPEDTVFLAMIESGFANYAYSRAKASGAWQFIGATGKRMGLKQDFWVDERRDPEKAAVAASKYLTELYRQTGDWRLAWAGYNAGVGKIYKARRKGELDFWTMARGKVLKPETKGYVPKLMAAAIIYKHRVEFGYSEEEIEREGWQDYELVDVPDATELVAIARAADVSAEVLIELNPELRRSCTPPRGYQLKVPVGHAELFAEKWPEISVAAKLAFANHRVQRGDTLTAISAAYNVSAATISKMNGLKGGRRLKPGTELVIPLSAIAKKQGVVPASAAVARARIREYQAKNPSSLEKDPIKAIAPRFEKVAGRVRAAVRVEEGDSLWAIAQKYGVGVKEIAEWNGIANPRRAKIQIGQELVIFPRSVDEPDAPAPAAVPAGASSAGPG